MIGRRANGCQHAVVNRYIGAMHVFTYGTLMFSEIWRAVAGRPHASVRGHLTGFAIYRVRDAVFPGIVATTTGGVVQGVVYLDVDEDALSRLDRFEDEFYERMTLPVVCDDGIKREVEAYVVPEERRDVLTDAVWSPDEFVARGDLTRFTQQFQGFGRIESDPN
jgi:gamma-glutamylcyclotransferase (GGCT)/AIG2-like uncharacterized protein YtfP